MTEEQDEVMGSGGKGRCQCGELETCDVCIAAHGRFQRATEKANEPSEDVAALLAVSTFDNLVEIEHLANHVFAGGDAYDMDPPTCTVPYEHGGTCDYTEVEHTAARVIARLATAPPRYALTESQSHSACLRGRWR